MRRPTTIIAELAAIALAGALAASLPQSPDAEAIRAFGERWPTLGRAAAALGLHDVMMSRWFLGLVGAALCSLLTVQWDQWRRVRRLFGEPIEAAALARAPFRREAAAASCKKIPERPVVASTGRVAVLGSPLFHLGIVVVLVAGVWRLLFFSDAFTRVIEGETLAPTPEAWQVQRGGAAARPFAIATPVTLEKVRAERYPSGVLRQLEATLALGAGGGPRRVAINAPLDVGGERVYLTTSWGVAALLEHRAAGGTEIRAALLDLEGAGTRAWGTLQLPDGREARLKARIGPEGRPDRLEVRLARGRTLLAVADLGPGAEVAIGPGEALAVAGLPYWVQLRGSRDPTRPLFFAGVAVSIAGAFLMFGVVRVDSAVFVEGERVVVALRPQRFAPLYAERFDALCKEWIG
ncbi:MAG TPA: cytochrome c biogenesis protein ResB [Anaeromyxobacter sp.]